MAHKKRTHLSILLLFALFLFLQTSVFADTKSYIVYLGAHGPNPNEEVVVDAHNELLGSILKDKEKAKASIFYYYTHNINGFAATLDEETAKELSKHPSVRSVIPDKACKLHTTHSWQFLGLENSHDIPKTSLWTKAKFGEGVIIANLDTGVWPESPSFNDEGFGPIPSKWKGICQNGDDKHFKCNRKLIGARFFSSGFIQSIPTDDVIFSNSPRDILGHGSHTLSTAGGSFVSKASIFGYGEGTAKGGSPHARVAAYKVCWGAHGCYLSDITQAIDMAIHDGVDVISMSIGMGGLPETYISDVLSIACFHAAAKGISVVASAGNHGPIKGMVRNHSPWVITVGASTMDREFPSYVSFNNQVIKGGSLSQNGLANKYYPMINAIDAVAPNSTERKAQICLLNALDPNKVKGKIVVCLRGFSSRTEKSGAVLKAGGVGMVLVNDHSSGNDIMDDPHVLPATHITYSDGLKLYSYLNTTKAPMGTISLPNMKYNVKPAPMMAAFSSRGPSPISIEILKPDITAPGVNILAAFTEAVGATENDTRRVAFNTMSGTSMSCPHVAGVVGLLKTLHPSWSPAMIKSAIMTTAEVYDNSGKLLKTSPNRTANPLQCGAGHIAPNRAMNPGLVYDISTRDYLNFLCNYAFNSTKNLKVFTNETFSCPAKPIPGEDLNYPAISVPFLQGNMTVTRTLTNVGAPSEYTVSVEEPKGVSVTVKPKVLKFSKYGEKKTYEVTFKTIKTNAHGVFGRLVWSDGKHRVASPLLASFCNKSEEPEFCDM